MVGRKKASSSTSKSTGSKQRTLFDLFPQKSVPGPVAQGPPLFVPQLVPQPTLATPVADESRIPIDDSSPFQTYGPIASTSKSPEIIDISGSSPPPPLKPLSSNQESTKPTSSRSTNPVSSSGPTRPPDPIIIDLTSYSDSSALAPPTQPKVAKPTYSIFAPRPKVDGSVPPSAPVSQAPKQTYSIFNVNPNKPSGADSPARCSPVHKESDAPFPTKDDQHRADGVLGNESNALYLRDWLRALEVRFETSVSLDGVSDASDYSSDVDGPVDIEGDDDDDFRPASGMEETSPRDAFRDHLANTIILSGPSGSGKTTAVYSCAEELGWEVFEVYPGIGKRNDERRSLAAGETKLSLTIPADFGFVTPKLKAETRQSVILLEEVDILFKEDANFWPAVIRLIRDCKRAVICTCNDISLIPTSDLPLQTILEFQPCQSDVAGSYLHGLCCAEGYIVNRDVLTKMYAKGGYDLRHTIHRLQMLCQGFPLGSRPEPDHLLDWNVAPRQSIPHGDLISFMDAYMTRGSLDRPTALALTQYVSSADDEVGHSILVDALTDGYGTYDLDTKFIAAVMELSRGTRVARADSVGEDYQELMDAFRNNPAFPVGLFEREVAHTEYLPWARQIIAGEDAQEARQERWGRVTRNSARYIRSVEIGEREREALHGKPAPRLYHRPVSPRNPPARLYPPSFFARINQISRSHVQLPPTSLVQPLTPPTILIFVNCCAPRLPTIHTRTRKVRLRAFIPTLFAVQVPKKNDGGDPMNVDSDAPQPLPHHARHMSHEPQGHQFDYTMRRHSIAVGQDPHSRSPAHLSAPHGIKRKMSADPAGFPTVGEESDPHLAGPGVPSGMDLDSEAPAPKRRGSAIDTQRIAQLSLNDRRDSLDSRGPQWWMNDRRDSTSSMFSSVSSVGGYSSGFSGGDSPHGRPPPGISTFAWPSSHPAGPDQPAPISMMPPMNFPPDRRMSVPDAGPLGPTRALRSRSRPPSRQKQRLEQSPDANHSGPSSGQDDPVSAPSPTGSGKHSKESSSTTPYSRSPELRVSHKLAERKRRKEMKELFDELRDQLPADRGMKASKWEILSKAIDFVTQLKQGHQDMAREIEMLRHELETLRPGSYPPGSSAAHPTFPPGQPPAGVAQQQPPTISRPASQNSYPPGAGQNGNLHRTDGPPS
ncbi:Transcription initiation factor [Mycena venus]|uniref:Transcription initiation factor n=1 Tax=Mycena venus TaxID=2733690 RepID=A0A8H6Y516_9AGAR|nr:Transcription initiation factor [Mycena venus]